MLPGKAFWITICLGDNGDKDEALQFGLQAFIYIMGFEQAVIGVSVEVNRERFFACGSQFLLQGSYKIRYPAGTVIVETVANEDVVFVTGDYAGHCENEIFKEYPESLTLCK
jgi:hypothetical protein